MGISVSLIGLKDGRLVGSFDDNTIKITNELNFKSYSILSGHTDLINTLTLIDSETIASGSCDNTIKIWNTTSLENILNLTNHTNCINSLIAINLDFTKNENPILVSASKDKTLKFWDTRLNELILTLNESNIINTVAYNKFDFLLATGSKE